MIKDFEQNFDVRDKQDALAMCALKLGTNAEVVSLNYEKNINSTNERLAQINQSLNEIGK
jgi:cell division protein ZapA